MAQRRSMLQHGTSWQGSADCLYMAVLWMTSTDSSRSRSVPALHSTPYPGRPRQPLSTPLLLSLLWLPAASG